MRVFITGVAGFLGSHLAARHLNAGDDVWGIDNFASSSPTSRHFIRLIDDGLRFQNDDIADSVMGWASSANNFDLIYNFACPASPPKYQAMPVKTLLTSVVGTHTALEIARANRAILVHASTSEVYGDPIISPQHEGYVGSVNSYGPRACYDEGKRAAEALCYDYRHQHNVDARVVRIFNTYGPNMDPDDGRVVTNFVKQALMGDMITIYGDGKQTRSFCYVDDLIDGIVNLATHPENPGRPINLGNPNEFTIMSLAQDVLDEVHGRQLQMNQLVTYMPLPKDDPVQRRPDISLARKLLDWEPKVDLRTGLKHMIAYMKEVTNNGR